MSSAYAIHIYYHHDRVLLLRFVQHEIVTEECCVTLEGDHLKNFLQRHADPGMPVLIFLEPGDVIFSETSIPIAFSEEDVMHYIAVEQAQLFPTLDEHIYFDFSTISEQEAVKTITIVACNVQAFIAFELLLKSLKLHWAYLGLAPVGLNLLPWRQRDQERIEKKRWNFFLMAGFVVSVVMLIISLCLINLVKQDRARSDGFFIVRKEIMAEIFGLEKLNKKYQILLHRWRQKTNIARQQSHLEKTLVAVDLQRPENVVLEVIFWEKSVLFLKGTASSSIVIKEYLERLRSQSINVRLKFMGNSLNASLPIQFEIECGEVK